MLNPQSPGTGTFDFWGKIESIINKNWENGKSQKTFSIANNGNPMKLTFDIKQMPIIKEMAKFIQNRNKSGKYSNIWDNIKYQKLIDQSVIFPFNDIFRNKKEGATYRASNLNISRHVSKFPNSLRLKGYMRCVPDERKKALDEIDYWATKHSNINGLKLHPRSDGWLGSISSRNVINVLLKAAFYNFPVIFDTRGKQSILDIGKLLRITREKFKKESPDLLKNLKVIIAHAASGNINDEEVYNAIAQPNTYMDMSLCQGKTVERFFKTFRIYCEQNKVKEKTGRIWSEFCLYATDYPFFQEVHANALISNLISPKFFNNGGKIDDIVNILGLNQIKLFPEYGNNSNFINNNSKINPVSATFQKITTPTNNNINNNNTNTNKITTTMSQSVGALIDDGIIDIKKIQLQFQGNWDNFKNEALFITSSKSNSEKIVPLMMMNMHENELGIITSIPEKYRWQPLGYKYFDKKTRRMFRKVFKKTFPATNVDDAVKILSQVYR